MRASLVNIKLKQSLCFICQESVDWSTKSNKFLITDWISNWKAYFWVLRKTELETILDKFDWCLMMKSDSLAFGSSWSEKMTKDQVESYVRCSMKPCCFQLLLQNKSSIAWCLVSAQNSLENISTAYICPGWHFNKTYFHVVQNVPDFPNWNWRGMKCLASLAPPFPWAPSTAPLGKLSFTF